MKTTTIHTIQKLFAKRVVMIIATVMMASGIWATDVTYTFTAATWTATSGGSTANWTNNTSGSGFEDNRGVANNGVNGAATSPNSYSGGVYSISVDASSNTTGGKVTIKIGSTTIATKDIANANHVTYTYTSADYANIATLTGNVKIEVTKPSSSTVWVKSITISYATAAYTVTYNAGTGSCTPSSATESGKGVGVVLPAASPSGACSSDGWTFAGWSTSSISETTNFPTLIPSGTRYHPTSATTLYAVYKLGDYYTIDFESAASTYTNWTFSSMTSQQQSTIVAHSGDYYGTTGGKASAEIVTTSTIASPKMIRFYVSKQTTNTTTSSWKLQTKTAAAATWTDVKTQDATDMGVGSWTEVTQDLSSYSNVYVKIYYTGSTAVRNIDDVVLSCATFNSNPSCCANYVSLSKGTESNGTITLGTTSLATCSGTATDRRVTVSVEPAQGYDVPATLIWTQTDGTAFAAPTKVSGPTKNGTQYEYVYEFPQNASGSGTFGVSGRAFTNFRTNCCTESNLTFGTIASPVTEYVIVRQDLASSSDAVTIDCNFESLNTTTAITWCKSYREARTFVTPTGAVSKVSPPQWSYFAIDVDNKTITASQTGIYTLTIQQAEAEVSGTTYCGQQASVTVTVKTVDKFVDAVNGNFSGEPQGLEDTGGGILLPTEETFSTNNGCSDGIARRLLGWIKESDLNVGNSSYKVSGRVNYIDDLKTGDASNKVIAPGTRVAATGITWYAVWGVEQE